MVVIVLIALLSLALALQILTGGFPVEIFAFPLNLIIAVIWLLTLWWLWKEKRKSLFVTFMLSSSATYTSLLLTILSCLIIGFTNWRHLAHSWFFVFILFYLQTVLFFVIIRGWRSATPTGARLGPIRWRFILLHSGLLLTISSAFWGAPDSDDLRLKILRGQPTNEAFAMDGTVHRLEYEFELKEFHVQYSPQGIPSDYQADIIVSGESLSLRVNEPYSLGFGKQLYLSSYDTTTEDPHYCILHYVYEPWKYAALSGIILMLAGAFLLFINGPKRRYNETD